MKKSVFSFIFLLLFAGKAFSMDYFENNNCLEDIFFGQPETTLDSPDFVDMEAFVDDLNFHDLENTTLDSPDLADMEAFDDDLNFHDLENTTLDSPDIADMEALDDDLNFGSHIKNNNPFNSDCNYFAPINLLYGIVVKSYTKKLKLILKSLINSGYSNRLKSLIFDCKICNTDLELIENFKSLEILKICSFNSSGIGYDKSPLRSKDLENLFSAMNNLKDVSIYYAKSIHRPLIALAKKGKILKITINSSKNLKDDNLNTFFKINSETLEYLELTNCNEITPNLLLNNESVIHYGLRTLIINECKNINCDPRLVFNKIIQKFPNLKYLRINWAFCIRD